MKEDGAPSRSSNSSPCQFLPISASQEADHNRRSRFYTRREPDEVSFSPSWTQMHGRRESSFVASRYLIVSILQCLEQFVALEPRFVAMSRAFLSIRVFR
jgi:hypothetical protein